MRSVSIRIFIVAALVLVSATARAQMHQMQHTANSKLVWNDLVVPGFAPGTKVAPVAQQQSPPVPSPARPGPTVTVQDNQGAETRGRLLRLDLREAVLLIQGQEVRFDLANVRRIEKRGDSLKNGAIIGAAFGLFGGLLGSRLSLCEPPPGVVVECNDELNPIAAGAAAAAVWGAIGVGIDALIVGRTTLYQAPTGTAALELRPTSIAVRVRW